MMACDRQSAQARTGEDGLGDRRAAQQESQLERETAGDDGHRCGPRRRCTQENAPGERATCPYCQDVGSTEDVRCWTPACGTSGRLGAGKGETRYGSGQGPRQRRPPAPLEGSHRR